MTEAVENIDKNQPEDDIKRRNTQGTMNCPHCKGATRIRNTILQSATVKHASALCQDPNCAFAFIIEYTAILELSPSAHPNPDIILQKSKKNYGLPSSLISTKGEKNDEKQAEIFNYFKNE